jgi:hypothetical protein
MPTPEQAVPGEPGERASPTKLEAPPQPLTTLRGAGVDFDARKVGQVIFGLCLAAMAVLIVVLTVAGVQKNDQITRLRQHGVTVTVTVTSCRGELGGSGSNVAGYSCRGTFSLDGRTYAEAIPGSTLHAPGATLKVKTVPGDPALLSTLGDVQREHASANVFILPAVLLAVFVVAGAVALIRRRGLGPSMRFGAHPTEPR